MMNVKLLKELYKQAETECGWSEEKFAELIVRECASQAALWTPTDEQGAEEQEKYILNHFGFKE